MILGVFTGVIGVFLGLVFLALLVLTKGCRYCPRRFLRWDKSVCCITQQPPLWKHDPHYEWDRDEKR